MDIIIFALFLISVIAGVIIAIKFSIDCEDEYKIQEEIKRINNDFK